jgi:hypothetical protein
MKRTGINHILLQKAHPHLTVAFLRGCELQRGRVVLPTQLETVLGMQWKLSAGKPITPGATLCQPLALPSVQCHQGNSGWEQEFAI